MLRAGSMPWRKLHRQIDTCGLWGNQHQISLFLKGTPWRRPTLEKLLRTSVLWKQVIWARHKEDVSSRGRDPILEQENSARRKEQWQLWWIDFEHAIPYHLCTIHSRGSRRVRNEGVKVESVKKWKMGKGVFMFLTMILKAAVNLPPKPTLFCLWY